MFRVPPVRLLFAHHRGPDRGRIPQPQLVPQLRQQPLEPGIVSAGFHPHPHRLPRQRAVKLFRFLAVPQPPSLFLPSLIVKDRDLLKTRMKITAYNQHDVGSSLEPWSCSSQPNLLAAMGQRRYAINRNGSSQSDDPWNGGTCSSNVACAIYGEGAPSLRSL